MSDALDYRASRCSVVWEAFSNIPPLYWAYYFMNPTALYHFSEPPHPLSIDQATAGAGSAGSQSPLKRPSGEPRPRASFAFSPPEAFCTSNSNVTTSPTPFILILSRGTML